VIGANLVMRTNRAPLEVLPAVKAAIWSVNPEQRLTQDVVTVEGHMDRLIAQRRFNMALLVLFGVLGLVITAAGIYGVMAYVVEQRTNEIGVRMALGATPRMVAGLIVGQALTVAAAGIAVGVGGAAAVVRLVRSQLFGVSPVDPTTLVVVSITFAVVTAVASWLPARRAAHVSPVTALREE
jgi:putative ABC transport system permease protein